MSGEKAERQRRRKGSADGPVRSHGTKLSVALKLLQTQLKREELWWIFNIYTVCQQIKLNVQIFLLGFEMFVGKFGFRMSCFVVRDTVLTADVGSVLTANDCVQTHVRNYKKASSHASADGGVLASSL